LNAAPLSADTSQQGVPDDPAARVRAGGGLSSIFVGRSCHLSASVDTFLESLGMQSDFL